MIRILFLGILTLLSSAWAEEADLFYTKVGFYFEKGRHLTLNYRRGEHVPVGTPVTLVKKGRNAFIIQDQGTQTEIKIENQQKFSRVSIDSIFSRYLSREKINLASFNPAFLDTIKVGKVAVGMTKAEVIASVGYPPGHQTPSLEEDNWKYWPSRYDTQLVTFTDGKVSSVLD